ncbi:MAG TPA: 30S ribosome-binding factor RbfA [Candidatus Pacearchaeota archaeon]|jgi:ribosome-binding factor A|nr:30S ribosome-binding factor RbfA [Candidatus Pacearchaeota archaeon]HPO06767.1 30S ribosome-binding factor RbfA [Candidatus Pacearchaeota archaeon]
MFKKKTFNMSEHRIEKIESLIHQVLGEMIQREFTPPEGALVSLTRIAVSGNLQEAKVYISVIPDRLGNEVVGNLQKNAWRFQEELNKKLKMRPVPKIIFAADRQAAQAQAVETIMEQLKK